MQKYKDSLKNTGEPILLKDHPPMNIDYRGLIKYARSKNTQPAYLTTEEKQMFIKP